MYETDEVANWTIRCQSLTTSTACISSSDGPISIAIWFLFWTNNSELIPIDQTSQQMRQVAPAHGFTLSAASSRRHTNYVVCWCVISYMVLDLGLVHHFRKIYFQSYIDYQSWIPNSKIWSRGRWEMWHAPTWPYIANDFVHQYPLWCTMHVLGLPAVPMVGRTCVHTTA